ncbi:GNAT family N-acetyltransferase [Bacillus marinisedimentorum]|uniref:GNAT family N-acetyltransferase n=1 Tax=Bacillus marinisedimentorum TaxID=1821260 RepID=UPI0007DF14E3|nr:GNAT family N-acetyltransferase [Bacillus marinisedimentorum]
MNTSHEKYSRKMAIAPLTADTQTAARTLILEGFRERFGFLDSTLNPDLIDPVNWYSEKGMLFLTGSIDGQIVCTGAITYEEERIARIERMSVKKEYRRQGLAIEMLHELERSAGELEYKRIVMETNRGWKSAVRLYLANGYEIVDEDEERFHFYKELDVIGEDQTDGV